MTEENFLNLIDTMGKPTANVIFNSKRVNTFSLRLETKQRCLLTTFMHNVLEVLSSITGKTREQLSDTRKGRHDCIQRNTKKHLPKSPLELMSKFCQDTRLMYKNHCISMQQTIVNEILK